jgi:hypothetical protein
MSDLNGFWSYVHADDKAENGRISLLAHHLVAQFEMLTGEPLSLFLDKDAIGWGEKWRDEIDSNLASVGFFVPVLTPRYFKSVQCRQELEIIARKASALELKGLIRPLLYIDDPAFHSETPEDNLIALVCTFQWEDWRELRFSEVTSEEYRRGVAKLATILVDANRRAEESGAANTKQADVILEGIDEAPGSIDQLAEAEEALPKVAETLQAIKQEIELIGNFMQAATGDINRGNSQGKGFSARLSVARRLAQQLVDPAEHIWTSSNKYTTQIHSVDEGFRIIFNQAPIEINEKPDAKEVFCSLFNSIRVMAETSHEALGNVQKMISASEPIESISRDLRPVMRCLRQGLTIMVETREVIDEWVRLIESSGVVC